MSRDRRLEAVLAASGLNAPIMQKSVSPSGTVLYGLYASGPKCVMVWGRLYELCSTFGLIPFMSHDSPDEWEWDLSGSLYAPRPHGKGILQQLVSSQIERLSNDLMLDKEIPQNPDFLSEHLMSRIDEFSPFTPEDSLRKSFSYPPEWVCFVEAGYPHELPRMLDAPSTPNWIDDSRQGSLSYTDHSAVLQEWDVRYGLKILYLGSGAIIVRIDRPPVERREVAMAALEQVAYCPDLAQKIGLIEEVARKQVPSVEWFFWWD